MAIRSLIVEQKVNYKPVSDELAYWLHIVQDEWNYKVVSVFETKLNKRPELSNQGFIILYNDMENEVCKIG